MEEPLIVSDPKVMVGKPIIKGTRIIVEHILNEIANGLTVEHILAEYPHLIRRGVTSALCFAAESVRTETVYPTNQPLCSI